MALPVAPLLLLLALLSPLGSSTADCFFCAPPEPPPLSPAPLSPPPGPPSTLTQIEQILSTLSATLTDANITLSLSFTLRALSLYESQSTNSSLHERLTGPPPSASLLSALARDTNFTLVTYDWLDPSIGNSQPTYIAAALGIATDDVLLTSTVDSGTAQPYFVGLDRARSRVLVGIRGSTSYEDWVANFGGATLVIAPNVGAHEGMYISTNTLLDGIAATVNAALAAHPGLTLKFIGHSLGGGVCALAAYMIKNSVGAGAQLSAARQNVSGLCTATPPVLTMNAAAAAMGYVLTTFRGDDCVVRGSLVNLKHLVDAVDAQPLRRQHRHMLDDGVHGAHNRRIMSALASGTSPILERQWNYTAGAVPSLFPVGSRVIYPMYSPGRLIQLLSGEVRGECYGVATGDSPKQRPRKLLLKANLIDDHRLAGTISCLYKLAAAAGH